MLRDALAALTLVALGCGEQPAAVDVTPVEQPGPYVVPFIGSGGFGFGFGSAFPGAAAPHGLVKVGPDTSGRWGTINFLHYSGYWYPDSHVDAFSHMHLHGTGATDYGVVGLMPTPRFEGPPGPEGTRYRLPLRKDRERAAPGFYAVALQAEGGDIDVELTSAVHAAQHRYRFPAGVAGALVLDLDRHLEGGSIPDAELSVSARAPDTELEGRLRSLGGMSRGYGGYEVYFVLRSRRPPAERLLFAEGTAPAALPRVAGKGLGAALRFPAGEPVEVQVGLSLVSLEGARRNLDAELPGWDFDQNRAATARLWDDRLALVRVGGGSERERRIFYSALYRSFLMPSVHSDVDGRYRGHDGAAAALAPGEGRFLSDLSLWDTYRTLHPLYTLLAPETQAEVLRSLLRMAQSGGSFPKWPLAGGDSGSMIGAAAEVLFGEAARKGLPGLRPEELADAYARLRAAALDAAAPPKGRGGRSGVEPYQQLHYVPLPAGSSVSLTMEFAQDDFGLAGLAGLLGAAADEAALGARARGWRRLFDPGTGFLRARDGAGRLGGGDFDPTAWTDDYREANAWQSLWPQHDTPGLAELFGGPEGAVRKLQDLFELARQDREENDPKADLTNAGPRPYYFHANEPDLHAAYLFAQLGRADLTQRYAAWAREAYYGDGPDGLPGNDDGGTLSAWYVLSALGLYPVPGSERYVIGAPLFPRAELRVPGGVFVIEAPGAGAERPYVREARLDGAPLPRPELLHREIRPGGRLTLVMSAEPTGLWR